VQLLTKIQNRVRGLRQKWGSAEARRHLWNKEFANGRWATIEDTSGDLIYRFIEKYSAGGSLLDLGCGSGNTGCELPIAAYCDYLGVDISDVALRQAQDRAKNLQRDRNNSYARGDIESFIPPKKYDVILFRESIYYVPKPRINATLDRYAKFLTPRGVMMVRVHDQKQGEGIVDLLEKGRQIVEKHLPPPGPLIFVLR
jgi:SAM-dependent methyltransferase